MNIQDEVEDLPGCPGDGEQDTDEAHGLDDAHLDLLRLGLSGARSDGTVGGHHARLTTDGDQILPAVTS